MADDAFRALVTDAARLAHLELAGDDEIDALADQMRRIVGFIDQLQAFDADAEAPDAEAPDADGASSSALERDDVVHPGLDRAVLLANAPATHDAFVTVPKMTVGKVKASGAENDA